MSTDRRRRNRTRLKREFGGLGGRISEEQVKAVCKQLRPDEDLLWLSRCALEGTFNRDTLLLLTTRQVIAADGGAGWARAPWTDVVEVETVRRSLGALGLRLHFDDGDVWGFKAFTDSDSYLGWAGSAVAGVNLSDVQLEITDELMKPFMEFLVDQQDDLDDFIDAHQSSSVAKTWAEELGDAVRHHGHHAGHLAPHALEVLRRVLR